MYEEPNLLERILFEDVVEVDVCCGSGGGVDLGVSGGVSSLMGARGKLISRALVAVFRVDLLSPGLVAPLDLRDGFLGPPVWRPLGWRISLGIPVKITKRDVPEYSGLGLRKWVAVRDGIFLDGSKNGFSFRGVESTAMK